MSGGLSKHRKSGTAPKSKAVKLAMEREDNALRESKKHSNARMYSNVAEVFKNEVRR